MSMIAPPTEKGGTTMVKLSYCWIGMHLTAAPACPWEEHVRRR